MITSYLRPILHQLLLMVAASAGDRYLLAGQSNAVGYTTDYKFSFSTRMYDDFIEQVIDNPELKTRDDVRNQIESLYTEISRSRSEPLPETDTIVSAESITHAVMSLYDRGMLTKEKLWGTVPHASCTYRYGDRERPENNVKKGGVSKPTPIRYDSGCGFSFGHEFFFARSMVDQGFYNRSEESSFVVDKVAVSGTSMYEHWFPGSGRFWPQVAETIKTIPKKDRWRGIIWHQGSQEAWTKPEDTSLTYRGNLTTWIDHVRQRMCEVSPMCRDNGANIPVIIVQVGYWPAGARMDNVRSAQASIAASDPYASLVSTMDLGRHYHYDALSFLVMGDRIAQEMTRFLRPSTPAASGNEAQAAVLTLLPILGIMVIFPFLFVLYRIMTERDDYTDYNAIEMQDMEKEDEDGEDRPQLGETDELSDGDEDAQVKVPAIDR